MGSDGPEADDLPTMASSAYVEIKRRILRLQLQPGQEFTETSLARELQVSKTPVREALARLRVEGLVMVTARTGYRVAPVTLKDARDLFALRSLLEGEAAAQAALNAGDMDHLRELERLCQTSYDPADAESIEAFLRANTVLHTSIAKMSGNGRLLSVFEDVLQQMERLFHLGLQLSSRAEEMIHEHTDLIVAIAGGDAAKAREVAVQQAVTSHRMVLDALLSSDVIRYANVVSPGIHTSATRTGFDPAKGT